ncbi:uncharacterized protein PAC_19439 [Phialocephala subalpina]|uniref:Rhodopsin domain-containing protein n=1 Tax=Phialocephala subalpina TaxID=576137 RepID=A0A1L7XX23_9HELO|nr:uncharacterized protein PAC_19439 [Phialocephala subalpina]
MKSYITTENGSRQVMFLVVMSIFVCASYVTVALRLYCRYFYLKTVGLDDYFMVGALVAVTGMSIMNGYHVALGTGRHTDELPLLEILIPTLKHCILALYRRILTQESFRRALWGVAGFITLQSLVAIFVNAFECRSHPSQAWSPSFPTGCNNLSATYYSLASINIVTDLAILILPLPVLVKLHLNSRRRWALVGIFSTGGVAIIASILRFYALYVYATTKDVAYDAIYILLWSQIEVNLAIISASAPALRPMFKKTFGGSSNRSQYGYGQSSGNIFRSQNTRGAVELHSYVGKNETTVKTAIGVEDDNSSQEHILEGSKTKIVKTVETRVFRD